MVFSEGTRSLRLGRFANRSYMRIALIEGTDLLFGRFYERS